MVLDHAAAMAATLLGGSGGSSAGEVSGSSATGGEDEERPDETPGGNGKDGCDCRSGRKSYLARKHRRKKDAKQQQKSLPG